MKLSNSGHASTDWQWCSGHASKFVNCQHRAVGQRRGLFYLINVSFKTQKYCFSMKHLRLQSSIVFSIVG